MRTKASPFTDYLAQLQKNLAAGHTTEGSHYFTMKALLESLGDDFYSLSMLKMFGRALGWWSRSHRVAAKATIRYFV